MYERNKVQSLGKYMRIPKKLKIGAHIVRVDASQELENVDGEAVSRSNLIRICSTLPDSQKGATLFHEIFHFMNTTIGDHVGTHAMMDSFAEQLYQVLSDNKLLK